MLLERNLQKTLRSWRVIKTTLHHRLSLENSESFRTTYSGFKQFYLETCYFLFTFQKHFLHGMFKNSYTFLHFLRVCRNALAQCGASGWNSVFRLTYLNVVKERTRFKTKTRRNNNFHQSMASVGKKRQKSTNGNTTLDKRSIVQLIKIVFKEECLKQQLNVSKVISNNLTLRNKKLESLEKRSEKKVSSLLKMFSKVKFRKLNTTFASLEGKLQKLRKI